MAISALPGTGTVALATSREIRRPALPAVSASVTSYRYIITATGVRGTATSEASIPAGADVERITTS